MTWRGNRKNIKTSCGTRMGKKRQEWTGKDNKEQVKPRKRLKTKKEKGHTRMDMEDINE